MATGGRNDPRNINNLLKSGTVIPNRIFVGGISGSTNEDDLRCLFSKLGNVKSTKVITDSAGISKGYGFVTFETEYEAQKIISEAVKAINEGDRFVLKERKLNIAPAIKKRANNRTLETSSAQNTIAWPMQSYSRPSEVSRDSMYYPQANWPLMWPQLYLQQQCHYPSTASHTGFPQYLYPMAPMDYPYQSVTSVTNSEYSDSSSADSGESTKNHPKPPSTPLMMSDYDGIRPAQSKPSDALVSTAKNVATTTETPANCSHTTPVPHLHFPVFAKTVNGVLMAYPSSFLMGNPVVQLNDGTESDNVLTEFSVLHSPIAPGSLTPPSTPLASGPRDYNPNSSLDIIRKK